MFSTKNFNGANGSGTYVDLKDLDGNQMGVYENIDQLLGALGGFAGMKKGTMLDAASHYNSGLNIGGNATEAIQNTVNDNKDKGDTTLYEWSAKDAQGTQYGKRNTIKNDKDSIEQFNKTHKTQPD